MEITIKPTTNPKIIKFEASEFLVKNKGYEFANIDEAKDSPLAQQLFYLPFIKKVYISGNFIALERYDIVEWEDVQEEVREQLESYLNDDGIVVNETDFKKVPVTVYAESTPNPSVMKFVANKKFVEQPWEFSNLDEAISSPLATELFQYPFVKSIYFDENFISLTKYERSNWDEVIMEIREFIRTYIENGNLIIEKGINKTDTGNQIIQPSENLSETSKEIINLLDEYVKPAVAGDGGNIVFQSYDEDTKTVSVILQGACSGCPSSTITLKNGIQTMLQQMLGEKVKEVVALNG
ncbi:NifU family protein [Aegicerativicinus sediminis]|uniref:NifU family protein n=1 Tax=Aegicerativicinus sediminis TaxID=2893202 RepID=UPI001E483269|nr:NifU family protein [Aegicerativicinus sediminis]